MRLRVVADLSGVMPDGASGSKAAIRASADSEEQFSRIYRAETPWLVRFFRRHLGNVDDAQDMTQETLIRFIRVAPSAGITTPQAYLRRIAINLLRDRSELGSTRLAKASVPLIEGLDRATDFDQYRELASREELNRWEKILAELKPRTLEIFLLSRVDGFTYKEIATRLGITVCNVKAHMTKAIGHVEHHRRAG